METLFGVLHALLATLAAAACVPATVLLAQVVAARNLARPVVDDGIPPRVVGPSMPLAVLVPAHDEAVGITPTLVSIRAQLTPRDTLLVVADNCSDETAQVARDAGAQVLERVDAVRRGKGYALDAGVRYLAQRSPCPGVVVVVDADCTLEPRALARIQTLALVSGRPVQAVYDMLPPAAASLSQRISAFAWIVRNRVRPSGAERLGWPSQLMGSGMAFPWAALENATLASGHLVEDLQLGVELALRGLPPLFCPDAVVSSRFPLEGAAALVQRTRWEHGHLGLLIRAAPRLLAAGFMRRRPPLIAMALDLAVPPLAALVTAQVLLGSLSLAMALASRRWLAFAFSIVGLVVVGTAIFLAWRRFARHLLSLRDLLGIPGYVLGKLSIYRGWLGRQKTEWIRTRR